MRRFALRIKFIVKTSTGFWWRGDGVRGEPVLAFLFCSAKTPPQNTPTVAPRKAHSSPSRSKSCRPNAAAAVKYIGAQQPRTPILLSEAAAGHRCSEAAIPIPLAQCMRSRAVVPRTRAHATRRRLPQRRLHVPLRRATLARPRNGPRDLLALRTSERKSHPRGAKPRHGLLQDLPS